LVKQKRSVYAIEFLAESFKNYYEFFKANYQNLDFFDVEVMKQENANAGQELEKTVKNIKAILDQPFGSKQADTSFDPLELQKDLQEKKKASGLTFLKKGPTASKDENLLDIDLGSQAKPQPAAPAQPADPKKQNGLNFLSKKPQPKEAGLLEMDLLGNAVEEKAKTTPVVAKKANPMDLFDLNVEPIVAETKPKGVQYNDGSSKAQVNKKSEPIDDLFDLKSMDLSKNSQKNDGKGGKKADELFDFGI
jgi:hypothetical protein